MLRFIIPFEALHGINYKLCERVGTLNELHVTLLFMFALFRIISYFSLFHFIVFMEYACLLSSLTLLGKIDTTGLCRLYNYETV